MLLGAGNFQWDFLTCRRDWCQSDQPELQILYGGYEVTSKAIYSYILCYINVHSASATYVITFLPSSTLEEA